MLLTTEAWPPKTYYIGTRGNTLCKWDATLKKCFEFFFSNSTVKSNFLIEFRDFQHENH